MSGLAGEVVLADSCSEDRTLEIASAYPIRIVQLLDLRERDLDIPFIIVSGAIASASSTRHPGRREARYSVLAARLASVSPVISGAALASPLVYWGMEAALLGSAVWLWSALLCAPAERAIAAAGATLGHLGFLTGLLLFAKDPLYAAHAGTTLPYGLTQLDDQQLAGVLMAGLGMLPYGALILWRLRPLVERTLERAEA